LTGRESNRGDCTHPCRWQYYLAEENRLNEFFPIAEDKRGSYLYNAKDLCLLDWLPQLIELGIDSLKIEGRMKNESYLTSVVSTYRQAIDCYYQNPKKFKVKKAWQEELNKFASRGYHAGFLAGEGKEIINYQNEKGKHTREFVGLVIGMTEKESLVQIKSKIRKGEELLIFADNQEERLVFDNFTDWNGTMLEIAQPHNIVRIKQKLKLNAVLRRKLG
jgi:U32 family peptidase